MSLIFECQCTAGRKKTKLPYLFQCELSYKNETTTNHHRLFSTSVWWLKLFSGVRLHGVSLPNFNFFNVNPHIFQRNSKYHLTNCLEANFHEIFNISLRVIRRRNYSWCEILRRNFFLLNKSGVNEIKWRKC